MPRMLLLLALLCCAPWGASAVRESDLDLALEGVQSSARGAAGAAANASAGAFAGEGDELIERAKFFVAFGVLAWCREKAIAQWPSNPQAAFGALPAALPRSALRVEAARHIHDNDYWTSAIVVRLPSTGAPLPASEGKRCVGGFKGTDMNFAKKWHGMTNWGAAASYDQIKWDEEHPEIMVHRGWKLSYDSIRDKVRAAVTELKCDEVHLTGASMGAALASFAMLDFRMNRVKHPDTNKDVRVPQAWLTACPHVGNKAFRDRFKATIRSGEEPGAIRVTNEMDPVPHFPGNLDTWSFKDDKNSYRHFGQELYLRGSASASEQCDWGKKTTREHDCYRICDSEEDEDGKSDPPCSFKDNIIKHWNPVKLGNEHMSYFGINGDSHTLPEECRPH